MNILKQKAVNLLSVLEEQLTEDAKENESIKSAVQELEEVINSNQKDLKTFLVIHEHKHGASTYFVESEKDLTSFINEENPPTHEEIQLIGKLQIDFELNRDESIEIEEINLNEIVKF